MRRRPTRCRCVSTFSETTNSSSFFSASRTAPARGSDTAGLVAITHSALISPRSIASNICTALRPSRSAMRGAFQNRRTRSTSSGAKSHMRGELVGEAADLAPAHRIGLAGQRERPHAGPADAAGGEMAVDDGVDLVGALRRLVHALREAGDRRARWRGTGRRSARRRLRRGRSLRRWRRHPARSLWRARAQLRNPFVCASIYAWSSAPMSARCTSRPENSAVSVPGAIAQKQIGLVAGRGAARIDHHDLGAAFAPVARHALEQHRMAPGGVGADQHEQIGLVEILVAARHRVRAEGAAMAGDRRGHAQPRIGVDVGRAEEALHQLVGDVIVLGQQAARRDRRRPRPARRARSRGESRRRPSTSAVSQSTARVAAVGAPQHRMQQAAVRARASRPAPSPSSTAGRNSPDDRDRR